MKKRLRGFGISEAWLSVNDQDLEWWPFAFLKPKPDQLLGQRRVLAMALLYSAPASLLFTILARVEGEVVQLWTLTVPTFLVAHALLSLLVAVPWNRRARTLANPKVRHRP